MGWWGVIGGIIGAAQNRKAEKTADRQAKEAEATAQMTADLQRETVRENVKRTLEAADRADHDAVWIEEFGSDQLDRIRTLWQAQQQVDLDMADMLRDQIELIDIDNEAIKDNINLSADLDVADLVRQQGVLEHQRKSDVVSLEKKETALVNNILTKVAGSGFASDSGSAIDLIVGASNDIADEVFAANYANYTEQDILQLRQQKTNIQRTLDLNSMDRKRDMTVSAYNRNIYLHESKAYTAELQGIDAEEKQQWMTDLAAYDKRLASYDLREQAEIEAKVGEREAKITEKRGTVASLNLKSQADQYKSQSLANLVSAGGSAWDMFSNRRQA